LKRRLFIFDVKGTLIDCVRQTLIGWRDAFSCMKLPTGAEHSRAAP
jgi:hypothetical protein